MSCQLQLAHQGYELWLELDARIPKKKKGPLPNIIQFVLAFLLQVALRELCQAPCKQLQLLKALKSCPV